MDTSNVKFSPSQWGTETPPPIKRAYQIIMFISALWLLVSKQFPAIPAGFCINVDHIMALGLPIMYLVCQCFGIKPPDQGGNNMPTLLTPVPVPVKAEPAQLEAPQPPEPAQPGPVQPQ